MNLYVLRAWMQARFRPTDERGANLVEYILLIAFIAVVVLAAVAVLGSTISSKFSNADSHLNNG
jgi:Flp pilus assembly pilin Flp